MLLDMQQVHHGPPWTAMGEASVAFEEANIGYYSQDSAFNWRRDLILERNAASYDEG
jgi:hypothetical protein